MSRFGKFAIRFRDAISRERKYPSKYFFPVVPKNGSRSGCRFRGFISKLIGIPSLGLDSATSKKLVTHIKYPLKEPT